MKEYPLKHNVWFTLITQENHFLSSSLKIDAAWPANFYFPSWFISQLTNYKFLKASFQLVWLSRRKIFFLSISAKLKSWYRFNNKHNEYFLSWTYTSNFLLINFQVVQQNFRLGLQENHLGGFPKTMYIYKAEVRLAISQK